jgi:hypothetical protein
MAHKICRNRPRFAEIAQDWSKLPKIGRNRPRLVKIAQDLPKSPKIVIVTLSPGQQDPRLHSDSVPAGRGRGDLDATAAKGF